MRFQPHEGTGGRRPVEGLRAGLRRSVACVALTAALFSMPAAGQTLQEALAQAYLNNPTLEAARAELRATDELVPQALAGYRPTVQAQADAGLTRVETDRTDADTRRPRSLSLNVLQPLYRGGRTAASVDRAEFLIQAQRAALLSTEQLVLLEAATAYLDVVRDQAVLELNINNEQVLRRQLEAAQDRFRVGEITRTDVSQAESRLAGAIADRIQAQGELNASRAAFARIVGIQPGELEAVAPDFLLPASLDETVELAANNNPQVVAAEYAQQAAESAVEQVRGERLPEANLRASVGRSWEPSANFDRSDSASVTAELTIPLYQAGAVAARVREARQTALQRQIEVDEAQREVVENAVSAWEALTTARAAIESRRAQVRAAEIALEGVRQEALVGARTILDVLDAEQELLDARVNLVSAQRDEIVAAFQVLAATGQLTARQIGLPVEYYEFETYYNQVRDKWWGTEISP